MNIARSFVNYMEESLFGMFGVDIFIGVLPLEAPESSFWILTGGGTPIGRAETGETIKEYIITVFYRSLDAEDVYDTLQDLENFINADRCVSLEDFEVLDIMCTTFPTDRDLDDEERTIGILEVRIKTYYNQTNFDFS